MKMRPRTRGHDLYDFTKLLFLLQYYSFFHFRRPPLLDTLDTGGGWLCVCLPERHEQRFAPLTGNGNGMSHSRGSD